MNDNREEITYDQYTEMLGKVPEGKRLIMTSAGRYFIADKYGEPILIRKKKKKK